MVAALLVTDVMVLLPAEPCLPFHFPSIFLSSDNTQAINQLSSQEWGETKNILFQSSPRVLRMPSKLVLGNWNRRGRN